MFTAFPRQKTAWLLLTVYLPLIITLELLHTHGANQSNSSAAVCCCAPQPSDTESNILHAKHSDFCPACQFALTHAFAGEYSFSIEYSFESFSLLPVSEPRFRTLHCASQRAPPQV